MSALSYSTRLSIMQDFLSWGPPAERLFEAPVGRQRSANGLFSNDFPRRQPILPAAAAHPATFVGPHEGVENMGIRSMTVRRFEEIQRRLSEGRGLREIARALGCSRDTVREVRDGLRNSPDAPKTLPDPL